MKGAFLVARDSVLGAGRRGRPVVDGSLPRVPPMVGESEIQSPGTTSVWVITNDNGDVVTVYKR